MQWYSNKPTNQPQQKSKLSSQLAIKLTCFFFWKAIFLTGLYYLEHMWEKKNHGVVAWPGFGTALHWSCNDQSSAGGFIIQPVSGRSGLGYGFGLLLCLFCFSTHRKRTRSVTSAFPCPTPLLSVSSPFYLDSKLWTTSCFFVAVTYYSLWTTLN